MGGHMDNIDFRLKEKSYRCYFELTLDLIGGKWKPIILYYLGFHGTLRYAELRRCLSKITERMLTKQLRELEMDKMVNRKIYPQIPPKVEYSLTEKGKSLIPLLNQLKDWGEGYFNDNIELFDHKTLELEE
ncbi:winged helix-turn-helix transcriptional regulator [Oceanirhabdus seepicola]